MARIVDIKLDQGTDEERGYEFYDNDRRPQIFEGYAAHMQMRRTASSEAVVDELSSEGENPRITIDSNVIRISWPKEVTAAIKAGRYCYDLEVTSEDGLVYRLMEGALDIRREVTR